MKKSLKVLQLIDSLDAGGAEMMAVNIANALADNGIASYLCATRKEGIIKNKIQSNVKYLFLNKKSIFDISAILILVAFIKKEKIRIIHAHSSSFFMAFLFKILSPSIKIIWHDHYGGSERLMQRNTVALKFISFFFFTIISVNKNLYVWSVKRLHASKYIYLPNFAELRISEKKHTSLKGVKDKRIICVANLRAQKDHITLLKAFEVLIKKYTQWTLHIVGLDLHDDYSKMLKKYISKNKLHNLVYFYGSCTDISAILEQATIGVLSSESEGLPLALLEYGMAKLPVVVTKVGDCRSVIDNGINGFAVTPSHPNELADKLAVLIENEELRVTYGNKLFHKIATHYSKEKYIEKLLIIYQN